MNVAQVVQLAGKPVVAGVDFDGDFGGDFGGDLDGAHLTGGSIFMPSRSSERRIAIAVASAPSLSE